MSLLNRTRLCRTFTGWLAILPALAALADEPGEAIASEPPLLICGANETALAALLRELRDDATRRVDVDIYAGTEGSTELNLARAAVLAETFKESLNADGIHRQRVRIHIRQEPAGAQLSAPEDGVPDTSAEDTPTTAPSPPDDCSQAWAAVRRRAI